jgi:hypothetical protein
MEAGGSHPMPLGRRLSRALIVPAMLVCWAIVPAAAHATALGTVESAVERVAPPVATVVKPDTSAVPAPAPAAEPAPGPVQQTVAPIANTAMTTVPPAPAPVAVPRIHEQQARAAAARISATASAERIRPRRATPHGSQGGTVQRPARKLTGPAELATVRDAGVAGEPAATASSGASILQPALGSATGGSASGGSAGFFFGGGGLALLVAWLLLAGPGLRRLLSELPAVCRPAAFLVVLERPG